LNCGYFLLNCQKFETVETAKTTTFKPINIRELFKTKSPVLSKFIPGFVYKTIHNVLQLDLMNDFIRRNGHLEGIPFIEQAIQEFNITGQINGLENIPESGRFIFASNHPLGGFDAFLLMQCVNQRLGKLKFLTNDILLGIPSLRPMFIPINKHGSNSREAAMVLNNTYDSDEQILIFPSGLASRKIKGKITDLEWKKHFISKSIKHKRDIIPVFIGGRNSNRFYRVANIRKFLRLKWNIEMFYLPDELVKHSNSVIPVYFGKPISYNTFNKSKSQAEWAEWVKDQVYKIPKQMSKNN
jgi:1-acyl-sn-glycerol-3-phosphate acyltransferase